MRPRASGPAGLLFLQALRNGLAFDGPILVSDPSAPKRALAARFGAEVMPPDELLDRLLARTGGRRAELLIEASGSGAAFGAIAPLIRKQATVLLYGIGHGGASLELLNPVQWREAVLVTSVGASGGFDDDGRPSVYRQALGHLERGSIRAETLVTHTYRGLARIAEAFGADPARPDYVKGVALL